MFSFLRVPLLTNKRYPSTMASIIYFVDLHNQFRCHISIHFLMSKSVYISRPQYPLVEILFEYFDQQTFEAI